MKQLIIDMPCQVGDSICLTEKDFHYICHVRRHSTGQTITVKDSKGSTFTASITGISSDSCTLYVIEEKERLSRTYTLELFCCFPKGKKLDGMVRQATEAGVSRITPLYSDHSLIQYRNKEDFSHKKGRLEKIIREAGQQSGSTENTVLSDPLKLSEISPMEENQFGFFCHQGYIDQNTLSELLQKDLETVKILIGPEGGLSEKEIILLQEKGFRPLYLGSNVLRAETASLFALSSVITIMELF